MLIRISLFLDHIWNISDIMCLILNCRNVRSQSCPFCRGSLKRVSSRDLWVLLSNNDMIDTITLAKENLRSFYLYIENLPLLMPDTHLFVYDYMLWLKRKNEVGHYMKCWSPIVYRVWWSLKSCLPWQVEELFHGSCI